MVGIAAEALPLHLQARRSLEDLRRSSPTGPPPSGVVAAKRRGRRAGPRPGGDPLLAGPA